MPCEEVVSSLLIALHPSYEQQGFTNELQVSFMTVGAQAVAMVVPNHLDLL